MTRMDRRAFSQKLVVESPELVCVYLRGDVQAVQQKKGEIILDLNRMGNWVRGFEMVGKFVPFSIAQAVSPVSPIRPVFPETPEPGTVTYDPEADAAFFYLEYDLSFRLLAPQEQAELNVVSHSINPTSLYGLDANGGLVWVKIPVADVTGSVGQFLRLLRR